MEAQVFDKWWIDSWSAELGGDRPIRAAKLIVDLADLHPDSTVLDFGCGIGLIAHALTRHGIQVIGIDRSDAAISEANRLENPRCHFLLGDWLDFRTDRPLDCAIFWFTTLCNGPRYDSAALRIARQTLQPNGTLLIETRNWDRMPRQFDPQSQRGSDECTLTEYHSYDPETGIQTTEEHYVAGPTTVSRRYQTRRYSFAQLREMCVQAGFEEIEGFDEAGLPLTQTSERMVLRARLRASAQ